ncbi:MAG: hypothetical protein LBM75_06060 [Myxococcales bacterium]|jgi:hypothetical protein|nr:hypothetical protein [Myxococcales bacterium]
MTRQLARPFAHLALALLASLALAPIASALPITERLDLAVGAERFLKIPQNAHLVVEPADLVSIEKLPPHEAFVVAKKPGRGLLFVASDATNVFEAVTLRVHEAGAPIPEHRHTAQELTAAQRACPGLVLQNTRFGQELEAEVNTLDCRKALLSLLRDDAFLRKNVAFSFTGELLQAQLIIIERRLAEAGLGGLFQIAYIGATLVIQGKATPEQRLAFYRIAWEETLGRFLFEDRTERLPSAEAAADKKPVEAAPAEPTIRVQSIAEMEKEHPELFEKAGESASASPQAKKAPRTKK